MKVIFLGAPGVGKGTYADRVIEKYHIPHISTGDILRDAVEKQTELGKKAKEYMDAGKLVPDDVIIGLMDERLKKDDCIKGYVLDGFPRTIPQAEALGKIQEVDNVINFNAPDELIIKRLSGRRTCRKCNAIYHIKNIPPKNEGICDKCGGELYQRDDEKPDVIKHRLEIYKKQTAPLINYYKEKGLLTAIDASRPPEEVVEEIVKLLE
jgi:adenylate kinase